MCVCVCIIFPKCMQGMQKAFYKTHLWNIKVRMLFRSPNVYLYSVTIFVVCMCVCTVRTYVCMNDIDFKREIAGDAHCSCPFFLQQNSFSSESYERVCVYDENWIDSVFIKRSIIHIMMMSRMYVPLFRRGFIIYTYVCTHKGWINIIIWFWVPSFFILYVYTFVVRMRKMRFFLRFHHSRTWDTQYKSFWKIDKIPNCMNFYCCTYMYVTHTYTQITLLVIYSCHDTVRVNEKGKQP